MVQNIRQEGSVRMKTIYLIGFMGSGKTTIARELSRVLRYPVIDLDESIVKKEGISISDIFSTKGEVYFRELEKEALRTLEQTAIVSTGGGIVVKEENREWMLKNGIVVFLDCELDEIWNRIKGDESRPLAKRKEDVVKLYHERKPLYQQCHIQVDTTNLTMNQTCNCIINELEKG